jgi:hypothetical protein
MHRPIATPEDVAELERLIKEARQEARQQARQQVGAP